MRDDDILVALKKIQAIPVYKNSKWIVYDKETFMKLGGTQKDWELYLKESGYTEAGIKKSAKEGKKLAKQIDEAITKSFNPRERKE